MGILEKIKKIEDEVERTQKNKATEHHLGLLKGQLSRLRSQLLEMEARKGGGGGSGFEARKSGDARVALIGFPSVGKSTLLNKITNTKSAVASYEYTTLTCVPGVLEYKGSKIQILDLPGIIEGAAKGRGRGKQVIACARNADLILLMLDAAKGRIHKKLLLRELEDAGIRVNKQRPNISFNVKTKGGVRLTITKEQTQGISERLVRELCKQRKIFHAEMVVRYDAPIEDVIDVIEGNRRYTRCLYLYNKIDTITIEEMDVYAKEENSMVCSLSDMLNIPDLIDRIWEMLDLVRVYSKKKGRGCDFKEPFILRNGATVGTVCRRIHEDFVKGFKYAMVWGKSAKYETGQTVGVSHVLSDEDVIQIYHTN